MTMQISIEAKVLRGLAHLAGVNDTRMYINGVWIEVRGGSAVAFATDGVVLGVHRLEATSAEDFKVLVPHEVIAALKSVKGAVDVASDDGKEWTVTAGPATRKWTAHDDVPPDFRRVIPRQTSGEPTSFNPDMVARFMKARKAFDLPMLSKVHHVYLAQNGQGSARVSLPGLPEFIGVVMPYRDPLPCADYPTWLDGSEAESLV